MRQVSHCATCFALVLASMVALVATVKAEGRYQRPVDRSTSTSPDLRFWRMVKDEGSCVVYVHRVSGQKRTFCDE
jgi:hypothetical protein